MDKPEELSKVYSDKTSITKAVGTHISNSSSSCRFGLLQMRDELTGQFSD